MWPYKFIFIAKLNRLNKYLALVTVLWLIILWMYPTNLCILGVIGVRMLETMDGEVTLEMETQWEGNCSCILSVGLPMGISLPAEVGS